MEPKGSPPQLCGQSQGSPPQLQAAKPCWSSQLQEVRSGWRPALILCPTSHQCREPSQPPQFCSRRPGQAVQPPRRKTSPSDQSAAERPPPHRPQSAHPQTARSPPHRPREWAPLQLAPGSADQAGRERSGCRHTLDQHRQLRRHLLCQEPEGQEWCHRGGCGASVGHAGLSRRL